MKAKTQPRSQLRSRQEISIASFSGKAPVAKDWNHGATLQMGDQRAQTKINQFQREGLQLVINQLHIVWFDVGVHQTYALESVQSHQQLLHDDSNLRQSQWLKVSLFD